MNGVGNGLIWGRSCGLNYRLWPGPHQTPVCSTFLRCRARPTNFSLAFWTDCPPSAICRHGCLLPSQQTALIVPSSHFPANYSLHFFLHSISLSPFLSCRSFSICRYPSLLAAAVATAAVMWPLPNHYCRLLAQNKKLKQVKLGGCWTESRMNESLLEGRASLHKAFAAPDCKGKSIPIKSINSLPSGNNKDFY